MLSQWLAVASSAMAALVAPMAMAMKEVVLMGPVKEAEKTSTVLAAQEDSKCLEAVQSTVLVVVIT